MSFFWMRRSSGPNLSLTRLGKIVTWHFTRRLLLLMFVSFSCLMLWTPASLAGLNDDRFDGDIFALYAGNGSLIPPKFTLEEAMNRDRPTLLVLYIDDSRDCKEYATVVSQLQGFYGRAADFLAIRVDALPVKTSYKPTEPGYYYTGLVPQTVLFDATGKMILNKTGTLAFEQLDDVLRQIFDLLPRSESVPLKRRQVNEVTTELVP